ncbi:HAD-IB family phosphatase [Patescibacteria group bacterium]|nr:HAD-IB family phosphatase [Patescibacteria group bacterium]
MVGQEEVRSGVPAGVIDIDGTAMRGQLCILYIEELVNQGLLPRIILTSIKDVRESYDKRNGPFSRYIDAFVEAYSSDERLKGLRVSDARIVAKHVVEQFGKRVHVFPREFALAAHDIGMPTGIISGSPSEVVAQFAATLKIDRFLGTEWPEVNGRYTGGKQIQWCLEKDVAIRHLAKLGDWDLSRSVAIGDSGGDIRMLLSVGYPICFNPERVLLRVAREKRFPIVIEKKNVHFVFRPDENGELKEVGLSKILPPDIYVALAQRLSSVNW